MSEAKTGKNHPMYGQSLSIITKAKISMTKGTAIYVYDTQGSLVNTFSSASKAAEYFNCTHVTILKYSRNGNIFKDKWKLSISTK
jgi:group I intron endonuclease